MTGTALVVYQPPVLPVPRPVDAIRAILDRVHPPAMTSVPVCPLRREAQVRWIEVGCDGHGSKWTFLYDNGTTFVTNDPQHAEMLTRELFPAMPRNNQ